MTELIRDTVFGHILRFITKGRVLQYAEEKDPSLWKQYMDRDQTRNMAVFGNPEGTEPEEKEDKEIEVPSSEGSSQTRAGDADQPPRPQLHSTLTAQKVDTEKGRDTTMVSWFGDNDPEVQSCQASVYSR